MRFFLFALLLIASTAQAADLKIEGTLRERGTRTPLEGVNVFCRPQPAQPATQTDAPAPPALKAVTDAQGRFAFDAVPAGPVQWIINFTGYERLERYDVLDEAGSGSVPPQDFLLEKSNYLI